MLEERRPPRRVARLCECVGGFFVFPPCLYFVRRQLAFRVILPVLALALGAGLYLARADGYDRRALWSGAGLRTHVRRIVLFFLPSAVLLGFLTFFLAPEQFLRFPLNSPILWTAVMLLYPLLAAYPQELLFRAFFFYRYRTLFPNDASLVVLNGISFGLAHLLYGNWIAVTLSTLGGLLFAYRYLRTGSLLAVSIEHGLWGDFLFTIGIGWYLYSGSIR
jgi:membrane protease YdiL (CAAX protease family)